MNIFWKVTMKNMRANRTRTLVTIIGILLSAAMFTAVTTSASSLMQYLIREAQYIEGSWYATVRELPAGKAKELQSSEKVASSVYMKRIGFAPLTGSRNHSIPYLCIYDISPNFTDLLPIHLTAGRMPENEKELLLPQHIKTDGGIDFSLHDNLTFKLGTRLDQNGNELNNHQPYQDGSDPAVGAETWIQNDTKTYKVVGFYEKPAYEDFSSPGFTALTFSGNPAQGSYDVYLKTKSGKDIETLIRSYSSDYSCSYHTTLLRLYGYSGESTYNATLRGIVLVLAGIVMFGSISLIYNAFSISVNERIKQFGLLSSIGATKRQLIGSVLFEAFYVSCIGIPLGVAAGLAGIGLTLYSTGNKITAFISGGGDVPLTLYASFPALAAAVFVAAATVFISAYLPARHAMKKSPLESIRLSDHVTVKPNQVKAFPLTQKLFGLEGMLAEKNFKRNRRKYRSTILSLFLSIVLFISSSSLGAYLTYSSNNVFSPSDIDIEYRTYPYLLEDYGLSKEELIRLLSAPKGIKSAGYYADTYFSIAAKNLSHLSPQFEDYIEAPREDSADPSEDSAEVAFTCRISFLEDQAFRKLLTDNRLQERDYFNSDSPRAIVVNNFRFYNNEDKRYYSLPIYPANEKKPGLALSLSEDNSVKFPIQTGAFMEQTPAGLRDATGIIRLIYPYAMIDRLFSGLDATDKTLTALPLMPLSENTTLTAGFYCDHSSQAADTMKSILIDHNLPVDSLYDFATQEEQERAMVTVIHIFSYGFIILISLIAVANVFHTISTNIHLRRREFAMFRSIGLTPGGFRKMMYFECLLYGFKSLIYGLPASVGVTWLIYRAVSNGLELNFFIPWHSLAIAIISVFLVVFATMFYASGKIKNDNTIDVLKDENL